MGNRMTDTVTLSGVDKDEILHILSNQRRRYVIGILADRGVPIDMRTLSENVASHENDKPASQLNSDEYKRVRIALHQGHLDKMEESGVIVRKRHMIGKGDNYEAARVLQKTIDDVIQFE